MASSLEEIPDMTPETDVRETADAPSVIGVVVPWGSGRKSRHASHAQNDYVALAEA